MFDEIMLSGVSGSIAYLIKYPIVGIEMVDSFVCELALDVEYYFNNEFQEKVAKNLKKHKKGRVYCDIEVTYKGTECISFLILISGYDGSNLIIFEYEGFVLNENGEMLPEWLWKNKGTRRGTTRNYYIDDENMICILEKTSECPSAKIPWWKLQGLVVVSEKYEVFS